MDRRESDQLRKEYKAVVEGAAQSVLDNLELDGEQDLDSQIQSQMHEIENMHPWVIDDDKAILVLCFSDHPCAEFFHYGAPTRQMTDNFPWGPCAGAALREDVLQAIREITGLPCLNAEVTQ